MNRVKRVGVVLRGMSANVSGMMRKPLAVMLTLGFGAGVVGAQTREFTSNSPAHNKIHIFSSHGTPEQTVESVGLAPIGLGVTNSNLVYNGGPVMRNPTNYLIFWQPKGSTATFPAGFQTGIETFLQKLGGTPFYNIVTQYNDGGTKPPNSTSWGGSWVDTATAAPSGCNGSVGAVGATPNCPLTDADIQNEVSVAISTKGWTANVNTEFFVFTPPGVDECSGTDMDGNASCFAISPAPSASLKLNGDYCAYHSYFSSNTIYAYEPFAAGGACYGPPLSVYPNGVNVDIQLSAVSHEMIESNTDPLLNAWKGPGGNSDEIGDKCAYQYGFEAPDGTNFVLNGSRYQIQWEWSNAANGCAKRLNPPTDSLNIPSVVNFGIVEANSGSFPAQSLNIKNSSAAGTGDANILYVREGVGSDPAFSVTGLPPTWATVHAGGTFGVLIAFAPSGPPRSATGTVIVDTDETPCDSGTSCTTSSSEIINNLRGIVVLPPTISKAFAPTQFTPGTTSTLSFQLGNPNTIGLTGVGFTDNLPVGMVVAAPSNLTSNCGGTATAAGGSIVLSNGSIGAGSSCTVSAKVTAAKDGIFNNLSGVVKSTEAGSSKSGASATAIAAYPPSLTKAFSALAIPVGGSAGLTFKLTNPNQLVALSGVGFSDALPSGLEVSTPNGVTSTCGGTVTAVAGSTTIDVSGVSLSAPNGSCAFTVSVTAIAAGVQVNVTSATTSNQTVPGGVANATITTGDVFEISYAANLIAGDGEINITNSGVNGAPLLGPGYGNPAGNICVNVYAFAPDEQLISCCSCLVTPNALVSLSVDKDLVSNTLTGSTPLSVVVKLVSTLAGAGGSGTSCTNSAMTATPLAPGLLAWRTSLHAAAAGGFTPTETAFTQATLSAGELASITTRCNSIVANGSGFGICKSCRAGGLGADKQ